jgi:hypothetical protein
MHNSKWQPTLIGKFNIGTDKPVEFVKQPVHIQDFWKNIKRFGIIYIYSSM